jgi:hypothetical protein
LEERRTQRIHDKNERLVPRTVMCIKAIDVDKDPQRLLIEFLHAGYIGGNENTMYSG